MEDCLICSRIEMIDNRINDYFVAELETGFVVIGDHQYFEGYCLFLCKEHKSELFFLDQEYKEKFLNEMSIVAEATYKAFKPDKLNYELLGNGDAHMHWHLFPRRMSETNPTYPVWWTDRNEMYSEEFKPTKEQLNKMKRLLLEELNNLTEIISEGILK